MTTTIRGQFPALGRQKNDRSIVYLDGPAGTQVPLSVIEAISAYYKSSNANTHGFFDSSRETDALLDQTRENVAQFLGAASPDCISFGANMTSLNYSLSRAIGRTLSPGDEVLITQLDHESNRGPWLALAELGVVVKEIPLLPTGQLDYNKLPSIVSEKTKGVAIGLASNIFGTVNDIARVKKSLPEDAWLLLDAVHYAPHFSIDVQALDCDYLLCSAYKFYGPHVGILYTRPGLLNALPTDRLRTQSQQAPYRIETGTLNHAALAGVNAALLFIADQATHPLTMRAKFTTALDVLGRHEGRLIRALVHELTNIPDITIWGPPFGEEERAPTISFTSDRYTAAELCEALAKHGIQAWDGHFYAIRATEVLGLLQRGGVTRMGVSMYNTEEEMGYTAEILKALHS